VQTNRTFFKSDIAKKLKIRSPLVKSLRSRGRNVATSH
jgi:hypothetical protein